VKLRWKAFETRLKARVRRYDARNGMTFWQRLVHFIDSSRTVPTWVARTFVSLLFAGAVLSNRQPILAHPDMAMADLGVWGLAVIALRAGVVRNMAHLDPDYRVLWILPVGPARTYRYLLRSHIIFGGSVWFFAEFLLVYGIIANSSASPIVAWAGAVIFALLQTGLSVAVVCFAVARRIKIEKILTPLFLLASLIIFLQPVHRMEPFLAKVLYVANPVGWVNWIYIEGWTQWNTRLLWLLLPVLVVSASLLSSSLESLRQMHLDGGFRSLPTRCSNLLVMPEEPGLRQTGNRPEQLSLSDSHNFLLPWREIGPLERLIDRFLNAREKSVVELLVISVPNWSRQFFGLLIYFALFLAVNGMIHLRSLDDLGMALTAPGAPPARSLVLLIAGFVLFAMILARAISLLFGFVWPEPVWVQTATQTRPYRSFRLFPATYWDTAKVSAKISTALFLTMIPLAIILSLTPGFQLIFRNVPHNLFIMAKCLVLLWGCSLLVCSAKLTPSLQDGLRHWKSSLRRLLCIAISATLGIAMLLSFNLALDIFVGALFLLSIGGTLIYNGARYRRGLG
jgi:hypothetical protein